MSDKSSYDVAFDGSSASIPTFYVSNDTVIPARSTSHVNLATLSSSLREGILEPRKGALARREILAPFCIVDIEDDHTILPILNILSSPSCCLTVLMLPFFEPKSLPMWLQHWIRRRCKHTRNLFGKASPA